MHQADVSLTNEISTTQARGDFNNFDFACKHNINVCNTLLRWRGIGCTYIQQEYEYWC